MEFILDQELVMKSLPDLSKYQEEEHEKFIHDAEQLQINANKILYAGTDNGIINAFLASYNYHAPLILSADDIHFCLQSVYSHLINKFAEEFRDIFVEHDGKKDIVVGQTKKDFESFAQLLKQSVRSHVKDPKLVDNMEGSYSTTTTLHSVVSTALILNSLKEYFSYKCTMMCGIPKVALEGSNDDWVSLKQKFSYMKSVLQLRLKQIKTKKLEEQASSVSLKKDKEKLAEMKKELDLAYKNKGAGKREYWKLYNKYKRFKSEVKKQETLPDNEIMWFDKMEIILDMFLEMRSEHPDQEYIKAFWKYVITEVPVGSGGDRDIIGWVSILQPVDGVAMMPMADNNTVFTKEQFYKFTDLDRMRLFDGSRKDYNTSLLRTPFIFEDFDGSKKNMAFVAGVYKHPSYDTVKNGIRPTYVFHVTDEADGTQ